MRRLLRRLRDAVLGPRRPAKRRDDSDAFADYVVETWRRADRRGAAGCATCASLAEDLMDREHMDDGEDPMDGVQGPDPLPARTLRGSTDFERRR